MLPNCPQSCGWSGPPNFADSKLPQMYACVRRTYALLFSGVLDRLLLLNIWRILPHDTIHASFKVLAVSEDASICLSDPVFSINPPTSRGLPSIRMVITGLLPLSKRAIAP